MEEEELPGVGDIQSLNRKLGRWQRRRLRPEGRQAPYHSPGQRPAIWPEHRSWLRQPGIQLQLIGSVLAVGGRVDNAISVGTVQGFESAIETEEGAAERVLLIR